MKAPIALLFACFAMGAIGSFVGRTVAASPEAPSAENASRVERDVPVDVPSALVERIEAIERRLDELDMAKPVPRSAVEPTVAASESESIDQETLEVLLARLDELEDEIDARGKGRVRDLAMVDSLDVGRDEMSKEDARLAVLDGAATEREKLRAWAKLRSGGWDEQVVAEMIRVAETSTDPEVRADVWRQADADDRDTQLVRPLLHALAHDPDASVRSEAAETLLGNYYDEPGVSAALAHAGQFDPDEDVRDEARGRR